MFIIPHKNNSFGVFADGKVGEFIWTDERIDRLADIAPDAKILFNHYFSETSVIVTSENRILYREGDRETRDITDNVRAAFETLGVKIEDIDIKTAQIRLRTRGYFLILYTNTHICKINLGTQSQDIIVKEMNLPLEHYLEYPTFATDSPDPQKNRDLYVVRGRIRNAVQWMSGFILKLNDGTIYFTHDLHEDSLLYRFNDKNGRPIIARWFADFLNAVFIHSEDNVLYCISCVNDINTFEVQNNIIDTDVLSFFCDLEYRTSHSSNQILFWIQKSDDHQLYFLSNSLKKRQVNTDILGTDSIVSFACGVDCSRRDPTSMMLVSGVGKVYSIKNTVHNNPHLFKIDYFDDNPIFVPFGTRILKSARTNPAHQ